MNTPSNMRQYLSLIKFSHTIFALPFAIVGFFIGYLQTGRLFDYRIFLLVLACMVFARSAAMAFNRYLDRDIDADNPRTKVREIPSGQISPGNALIFVVVMSALFIACTWFINPICFYLSPIALLITLGYSYTKRFTALCHFVLGLGLALAPVGANLAVTGQFHLIPILYGAAVLMWVAGFDIIYALQDDHFDKEHALHSIPVSLGRKQALMLSTGLHILCALLILMASYSLQVEFPGLDWIHWIGSVIFVLLLMYQHYLVSPKDLSRVNLAFFTTNGIASLILGSLIVLDVFV